MLFNGLISLSFAVIVCNKYKLYRLFKKNIENFTWQVLKPSWTVNSAVKGVILVSTNLLVMKASTLLISVS